MERVLEDVGNKQDRKAHKSEFKSVKGSQAVKNQIKKAIDMSYKGKTKDKDKSDRSVVEKVIDKKTEKQFEKWQKNGVVKEINGCISTGKEANVYHAVTPAGKELAIKIYKVETMVFRDREEYIEGEHRFKKGHVRSSPYKLIKVWAEKEFRNLKRIRDAGLNCPEPILMKDNLIMMEFLGNDGNALPRLKDATFDANEVSDRYNEILAIMRDLYQKCNLVHGDLSSYNLLWNEKTKKIFVIDVSQSVEDSHPLSQHFLRRDIRNINREFRQAGVKTFICERILDFIRDKSKNLTLEERKGNEEEEEEFVKTTKWNGLDEVSFEEVEKDLERIIRGEKPKYLDEKSWAKYNQVDEESENSSSSNEVADDKHEDGSNKDDSKIKTVDKEDKGGNIEMEPRKDVQEEDDDEEENDEDDEDDEDDESSENEEANEAKAAVKQEVVPEARASTVTPQTSDPSTSNQPKEGEAVKPVEASKEGEAVKQQPEEAAPKRRQDDFTGMSKDERKKLVKTEKREKREKKMKKKDKKKLIKKSTGSK